MGKIQNQLLVDFLKSDDFSNFLNSLVATYTKEYLQKVEDLEIQLKYLNKSNKMLVDLLTTKNNNVFTTRSSTVCSSKIFGEYTKSEISLHDLDNKRHAWSRLSQENSIADSEVITVERLSTVTNTKNLEEYKINSEEILEKSINESEERLQGPTDIVDVTQDQPTRRRNNIIIEDEKKHLEKDEEDEIHSVRLNHRDFKRYIIVGISRIDDKRGKLPFEYNGKKFCINLNETQTLEGSQKHLKKCLESVCPGKYLYDLKGFSML